MAINPTNEFVGKIDNSVPADYPYGKAQNITTPGDGTGTPWRAALTNDLFGFQQALLKSAGIVPSGTPEKLGASEYLQAVVALASGRAFNYDESGVANAYVLDVRANQEAPNAYFDGMVIIFTPGNDNTGASTVNAGGLGVVNLLASNGDALVTNQIQTSNIIHAIYNTTAAAFLLTSWHLPTTVVDYNAAQNIGFHQDAVNSNTFSIYTAIGTAFESIGPSGSGALNTWVALNDVPKIATGVLVSVESLVQSYGVVASHRIGFTVTARSTGSVVAGRKVAALAASGYTDSTSVDYALKSESSTLQLIPVDSSGRFDLKTLEYSGVTTGSASTTVNSFLKLVGWVE